MEILKSHREEVDPIVLDISLTQSEVDILSALLGQTTSSTNKGLIASSMYDKLSGYASMDFENIISDGDIPAINLR